MLGLFLFLQPASAEPTQPASAEPTLADRCDGAIRRANEHGEKYGPSSATSPENRREFLRRARVLSDLSTRCTRAAEQGAYAGEYQEKIAKYTQSAKEKLAEMKPAICTSEAVKHFEPKQLAGLLLDTGICSKTLPGHQSESDSGSSPGSKSAERPRLLDSLEVGKMQAKALSQNAIELLPPDRSAKGIVFVEVDGAVVTYSEKTGIAWIEDGLLDAAGSYSAVRQAKPDLSAALGRESESLSNAAAMLGAISSPGDTDKQEVFASALAVAAPEQMLEASRLLESAGLGPNEVIAKAASAARVYRRDPARRVEKLVAAVRDDDALVVSQFWDQVAEVCTSGCQIEFKPDARVEKATFDKVSDAQGASAKLRTLDGKSLEVKLDDITSLSLSKAD